MYSLDMWKKNDSFIIICFNLTIWSLRPLYNFFFINIYIQILNICRILSGVKWELGKKKGKCSHNISQILHLNDFSFQQEKGFLIYKLLLFFSFTSIFFLCCMFHIIFQLKNLTSFVRKLVLLHTSRKKEKICEM